MTISDSLLFTSIALALAILLDAVFGDPDVIYKKIPHPVAVMGAILSWLEKNLNTDNDDNDSIAVKNKTVIYRGMVAYMLYLMAGGGVMAVGAFFYGELENIYIKIAIDAFIGYIFIAQKSLFLHVRVIFTFLEKGDIHEARKHLSYIVTRKTGDMDEANITRTSIESLSENFSDAVIAPAFYFLLFGPFGIVFYKMVNTADSMWGYKSARYINFGAFAARMDDILNFIPARLSIFPIVIASLFHNKTYGYKALLGPFRHAHNHASPNAGWPEAAFAGALNIALGGRRYYENVGYKTNWIGDGKKNITPDKLRQALTLFNGACAIHFLFILLLATIFVFY